MNEKYICYCGLYCENCATKAKVEPAAKILYTEMKAAGFEDIIPYTQGGENFWMFLKNMAEHGTCTSCREGSGNPGCMIRMCAKDRNMKVCAFCENYPCEQFDDLLIGYPSLKEDNILLQKQGLEAWAKLQDERRASGYTYNADKMK